ncbi:MAG: hypothetical protein QM765_53535 [Myxococcales bacterium]
MTLASVSIAVSLGGWVAQMPASSYSSARWMRAWPSSWVMTLVEPRCRRTLEPEASWLG